MDISVEVLMSSKSFAKSIGEIVTTDPAKALELIVDRLEAIIDQPSLPPEHPDEPAQRLAKSKAQTEMDKIRARLRSVTPLALKRLREIIDLPPLPPDHPHAAALQEEKRSAQTTLLHWNAHYGPGGLYEGLEPKDDESRGGGAG
jgi:hypothetical protein